jgi:hypothetical protein
MFYKHPETTSGTMNTCVKCFRKRNKEWKKKNSDRMYNNNKNSALRRKYGISENDYKNMFNKQNGLCAVCLKPETTLNNTKTRVKLLAVDHCHETNKIRGLLCALCNQGLGKFKDNEDNLTRAINYLRENKV